MCQSFYTSIWHADSHLREPEVKVLDARIEILLLVGLFEFLALFCRFVDEELPLFIQSVKARLRNGQVMFEQNSFSLPHYTTAFKMMFSHITCGELTDPQLIFNGIHILE